MARKTSAKRTAAKSIPEAKKPSTSAQERVVVQGLVPRMQSFNLPHEIYCAKMGKCFCHDGDVVISVYSTVDKGRARHLLKKKKRMNSTLSIRFRQRLAIPRAALACPEVAAALREKWIRAE